jgi:hypothetical protein
MYNFPSCFVTTNNEPASAVIYGIGATTIQRQGKAIGRRHNLIGISNMVLQN